MDTKQRTMADLLAGPAVLPVPEAGSYLGLSRSGAYEAARTGVLPIIRIGRKRMVVPAAKLAAMLGAIKA
jgi:hypothetical protein